AAPHAGRLQEAPRAPMRLLHAGNGDGRGRPRRHAEATERSADPRSARRQFLPLHRLSQHREGGAGRHQRDGVGGSMNDTVKTRPGVKGPIGARVERKEDARFLTGAGQYTDDVKLANQSYAYFLRSPHAHAKIKSIKTDAAKKSPGVLAIYTGADLPATVGGL